MTPIYKVGTKAKLCNLEQHPEYEGTECTIVAGLQPRQMLRLEGARYEKQEHRMVYKVRTYDDLMLGARPDQLKPLLTTPDVVLEKEEAL